MNPLLGGTIEQQMLLGKRERKNIDTRIQSTRQTLVQVVRLKAVTILLMKTLTIASGQRRELEC